MQKPPICSGVSSACFFPQETICSVKQLTDWKVPNIEVFFNTPRELEDDYTDRILELCEQAGTKVVSVHPFTSLVESMFFFSDYPGRMQDACNFYRRYFKAAQKLGAKLLVFHGDSPHNHMVSLEKGFVNLKELDKIAKEEYGIRVAYENVSWCRGNDPDYFVKLLEYYPEMTFVLDVKQALRAGRDPLEYLEKLKNSIVHIHISDSDEGRNCLPIGMGKMDVPAFLQKLVDCGFSGCVLEEVYRDSFGEPQELCRSYQKLKEAVDRIHF